MWYNEQQAESIFQRTSSIPQTQPCATRSTWKPVHDWNETRSQDENPEQSDLLDATTSIFNKIVLRIDGVLETAILRDENADARHNNKGDSEAGGEQSRLELIELRQTTTIVQCPSCWKHVPDGLINYDCGWFFSKISISECEEIMERFRILCRPQRRGVISSKGQKSGLQPWQILHK